MLEQLPAVAAAVAAESFTTEQVCKILSTVRDRNKMEDWTAGCLSNKNDGVNQFATVYVPFLLNC